MGLGEENINQVFIPPHPILLPQGEGAFLLTYSSELGPPRFNILEIIPIVY